MNARKTVGDLMIEVRRLPCIAADAPLREAIEALLRFLQETEAARPTLVVLDGERMVGVITQRDLLAALEPGYLKQAAHAEGAAPAEAELVLVWDRLFDSTAAQQLARPVVEFMRPVSAHLAPGDPVARAAWLMLHEDLPVVPVMQGTRIVGVVRAKEVFVELMQRLLAGSAS